MSLLHTMKALDLLDSAYVSGESVKEALVAGGVKEENISVKTVTGPKGGSTDFVKVWFYGSEGRHKGGSAPTIGIVGRLGGIGAQGFRQGFPALGQHVGITGFAHGLRGKFRFKPCVGRR